MNSFLPEPADTGRGGRRGARGQERSFVMNPPTRTLREHPDLDQLKRQARELLDAFRAGTPDALAEVARYYRGAHPAGFSLHDAQLVLARAYGFESWPKLKAHVNGVTVQRLCEAVQRGDLEQVRAMLAARPELANTDMAANNEHRAIHYAVMARAPEMVRLLMRHGADARKGIYPHRDATSAFTLASDRGYAEIVSVIQEEENRRCPASAGDNESSSGAVTEAARAVMSGDAHWLRTRHAAGTLENRVEESGGLLSLAIKHDRPEILALLLDLGFDPDEPARVGDLEETVLSRGMPLWHCAVHGKHAMARLLLERRADPNAQVYAGGTPLFQAYGQRDSAMIELLQSYGAKPGVDTAGHYRLTDMARDLLQQGLSSEELEELLWAAACGGDPEIVRLALERIGWPRGDPRWYQILEQPLRLWNHGPWFWANPELDRGAYLACFGLVLRRCDPNLRGRFGMTILHDLAASRKHMTPAEGVAFATLLLDAGARMDIRDGLLHSTPLGWACRWGRVELVELLLSRGADPVESEAEPWATPAAWAQKHGHDAVLAVLRRSLERTGG
jgi:ankyrin repeat protein